MPKGIIPSPCFASLSRSIYAPIETIIDPLLSRKQAGFRRRRSTVDQITLMTQEIEDCFSAKKKADAVFVDLTATYDSLLCGIEALSVSSCGCFLTDTWSESS